MNIANLTGLEYCTNLHYLYLYLNHISDILPLANLTNLTILSLNSNQISDISPLANITNLTWLNLDSNQIIDIKPLVNNPGLSDEDDVYLENNPLSETSISIYIPQLESKGVTVYY